MDEPAPRTTAIPWFRKDDWHELRTLFAEENDPFPETWDAWYASAVAAEAYLKRQGWNVVRAQIVPDDFRHWCQLLEIVPDANARARWANGVAGRQLRQGQNQPLP